MHCERCNVSFPEGLRYCKWCGQPLADVPRSTGELVSCPDCNAAVEPNWSFCKACGGRLGDRMSATLIIDTQVEGGPDGATSVIAHCSVCHEQLDPGSRFCKGCGAPARSGDLKAGASSLLCPNCNSHSPLGSPTCRVCGKPFASTGQVGSERDTEAVRTRLDTKGVSSQTRTDQIASASELASTLRDLSDHVPAFKESNSLPSPEHSEVAPQESVPPAAGDEQESSERHSGGATTTVLPGVAGSQTELPSPTTLIGKGRTTGPVDYEPDLKTEDETPELPESAAVTRIDVESPFSSDIPSEGVTEEWSPVTIETIEESEPALPTDASSLTAPFGGIASPYVSAEPEIESPDPTLALVRDVDTAPFAASPEAAQETIAAEDDHREPPTRLIQEDQQPSVAPIGHQEPAPVVAEIDIHQPLEVAPRYAPEKGSRTGVLVISAAAGFMVLAAAVLGAWYLISGGPASLFGRPEVIVPIETPPRIEPPPPVVETPAEPVVPVGMVFVPPGTYTIGTDDGDALARPARSVELDGFFIDRTEVTNAEYRRFVDATGHRAPDGWVDGDIPAGHDNRPVVGVSWYDASAYAAWLGKRLPTEEEWEAAARGIDGLVYPWGNEWQAGRSNIGTQGIADVGSFESGSSPFGALDMIGNVWEWVADEFELYPGTTARMPAGILPGVSYRVIRGGAFDGSRIHSASYRGFVEADKGFPKTGFRCAQSAPVSR